MDTIKNKKSLSMKLIYISNTRIPSEKANTYQSMVMCDAFSKYFNSVEFWYPKRNNTKEMEKISDPFSFYEINNSFKLKKVLSLDFIYLYKISKKIWFLLKNITFSVSAIINLRYESSEDVIFVRDVITLKVLSLMKNLKLIKQKVYFEAHSYSMRQAIAIKDIDGLIVINNHLKELYEKNGIKSILVAHDGVNISEYKNLKAKEKKENVTIVYTGNLFEWKGVYTLADSLKYLNNVSCIIVGGSDDTLPQFKEYINSNKIKNVKLTGFVKKSETIKYLENADVLILPNSAKDKMSYYTSPLKLFEYMASKRPIVASKLPSLEEVLVDKVNSILFEPDNPKDLADKINWVLENDCSDIIGQAYKDVQEYTWDKRAKNIMRWMERC